MTLARLTRAALVASRCAMQACTGTKDSPLENQENHAKKR